MWFSCSVQPARLNSHWIMHEHYVSLFSFSDFCCQSQHFSCEDSKTPPFTVSLLFTIKTVQTRHLWPNRSSDSSSRFWIIILIAAAYSYNDSAVIFSGVTGSTEAASDAAHSLALQASGTTRKTVVSVGGRGWGEEDPVSLKWKDFSRFDFKNTTLALL